MPSWAKKLWSDPVLSKVIGGLLTAGILALLANFAARWSTRFTLNYGVPLWLVITICAGVFISSVLVLSRSRQRADQFLPEVKHMGNHTSDPDPDRPRDFPLKCWWTFRNDSNSTIDVVFWDFTGQAIKVKSQAVAVLQVQMVRQWLPADHGVAHLAVIPGQLFRGWIAPDENLFTAAQVKGHFGNLGQLTLKINGKLMDFKI